MGSDSSPFHLFQGVLKAAKEYNASFVFVVIATPATIDSLKYSSECSSARAHIEFHPATEIITMTDEPLTAIRRKKNASLIIGMRLLNKKRIDALVSAGNTGALITCAKIILSMLPGIRRPALLTQLPTKKKRLSIIDAGGNTKNTPTSLIQYAQMGVAYQRCYAGIEFPAVGLLNVGVEPHKGPPLLRETYALLKSLSKSRQKFHFLGNIEARNLFEGNVDVLVTDGFTGNVLLKTAEGTATYILDCMSKHLPKISEEHDLRSSFNYTEYPGALVCGVDRVLIKCHGDASQESIYSAICGAIAIADKQLIAQIHQDLML